MLFQWQMKVNERVYAQPLTATVNGPVGTCHSSSCDLVFVASEEDWLYAFNTSPSQFSQTPVWSINLASKVTNVYTGSYVDCTQPNAPKFFSACVGTDQTTGEPGPFSHTYIGVTGTPVIDMNAKPDPVLYAVAAVCFDSNPPCNNSNDAAGYYLFAVDIVTQSVTATEITGQVPGKAPSSICTSDFPTSGNITFSPVGNPNAHLQRSALLLLPVNNVSTVFVAFADLPERNNGWMFGYQLTGQPGSSGSFTQTAIFSSTPYGTGGGFWGAGAGPAADANGNIYTATANGTIFDPVSQTPPVDLGDALLRLQPGTTYPPGLAVVDWWTPPNVLSYPGPKGQGLCKNDMDLSSGGVLLPTGFTYNGNSVVINADKQSNIYVTNQSHLGGYNTAGGNNIETVLTPCVYIGPGSCELQPSSQGYWSSPAYWFDGMHYWLYYAATMNGSGLLCNGTPCQSGFGPAGIAPEALNAYQMPTSGTTGPISQIPFANSGTSNAQTYPILFCDYAPTPSVSSNGNAAGSGIVWAIEQDQNNDNNPKTQGSNPQDCAPPGSGYGGHPTGNPGALHAFCAAQSGTPCPSAMTELYSSRPGFSSTTIGPVNGFPTPTIFEGQEYVGTNTEVDVFGLCSTLPTRCIQ